MNFKTGVSQVIRVVDFTSSQVLETVSSDYHPSRAGFHDFVARLRLGHFHLVLPAGTAAAADSKTQAGSGRLGLISKEFAKFFNGFRSDGNHVG